MGDDVRRAQAESKKKIAATRNQDAPTGPPVSRFRNTPAGRRLAALRDRKEKDG